MTYSYDSMDRVLLSMKNTVRKVYESVDSVELEVKRRLKAIDIAPIEQYQFENLDVIDITSGRVGISSEVLEILDRIEALSNDQTENLNKFNNTFRDLLISYDSVNNEIIEDLELEINTAFHGLRGKRISILERKKA